MSKQASKPWTRLQAPARITLTGLYDTGKSELLARIAPYGDAHPDVVSTAPSVGVVLGTLQRDPLTMTTLDLGGSRPKGSLLQELNTIRENADGIVFIVDCRNHEGLFEVREEMKRVAFELEEVKHRPLLVLANWWEEKVSFRLPFCH